MSSRSQQKVGSAVASKIRLKDYAWERNIKQNPMSALQHLFTRVTSPLDIVVSNDKVGMRLPAK